MFINCSSFFTVAVASLLTVSAPWFTDRAVPASFFLGVASLICAKSKKQKITIALILISGAALLTFYYYRRFGVPYPVHHNQRVSPSITYIFKGFPMILLERNRGILWFSPILVLTPVAFWRWWKSGWKRTLCALSFLSFFFSLLIVASFPDWSGGTCPAGRYGVIFQWIALPAFLVWAKAGITKKQMFLICMPLIFGVMESLLLFYQPNWWYRKYHPLAEYKFFEVVYRFLPDLQNATWIEIIKAIFWAGIFFLYAIFTAMPYKKDPSPMTHDPAI